MSSSPTSSSSTSGAPGGAAPQAAPEPPFPGLMDVPCRVSIRFGSGSMTVRECLALTPHSIIRLVQPVGEDLDVCVHDVVVAKGEVAIVDDSTSIRLTDILVPAENEVEA
jgi:flagellar motor switch protein FliN